MSPKKSPRKRRYFLGFDGGGSKTDCVLADAKGAVVARSTAGASNPLRAGYSSAWRALHKAADAVLAQQHLKPDDVRGVCAGIAGAGRESVARRAVESLQR
ncbi:MAG: BadF/BadG/BcrA/BcrD ATPase family protein, partial [Candidatus Acidiferrales bacterium]